ncbi:SET domain-containing protein [Rhizopogon vinicolor AM-OR11-026]|uniref:Ribosomal lysine N-methyltransferase 4 n=1 Tax=Rhizopogon vinicolor AM-OR11-026 TaxID=1314800 RepID=A0A1B7MZ94_9AGAM|nr:SET domain-containing protein [Rhizopogon vinicolor AM-OR11-026]
MDDFIAWFQHHGGALDTAVMSITDFPGSGRGAIAVKDIPENHTIFTLPRSLTLSTQTSTLPSAFGITGWRKHKLHKGWVGLILCMMWEEAHGNQGKWSAYFVSLPTHFGTPMFWSNEELQELQGTAVVDKIGRVEAERDYHEKLIPAIKTRPDLFPSEKIDTWYTLQQYHIAGNRILSRSFQVERWKGEVGPDSSDEHEYVPEDSAENTQADTSIGSAMDVDGTGDGDEGLDGESSDSDSDDSDIDDSDVAMVPMADLLNARYDSENAKLFYEEHHLQMVTTKPIKAGEQIFNTYGDPPNSDLLRRYGHVDLVPCPHLKGALGNPQDIVEIRADLVVKVVCGGVANDEKYQQRIDWWLDEGGDDVFVLDTDPILPAAMTSLIKLLLLSQEEWEKTREKERPPKAKFDRQISELLRRIFEIRLSTYQSPDTEADEKLLASESLTLNMRHAIIVRLGEKRILAGALEILRIKEAALDDVGNAESKGKKRVVSGGTASGGKSKKARH